MDAMEVGAGIMGLTRGCFCKPTMKNISVVKKFTEHFFRREMLLGAGYGIMPTPLPVVPLPTQQKDVSHVTPPTHHRASA